MVATRRAVFAKTDSSTSSRRGTLPRPYNGLCRLVKSGLKSVFGGSIPRGETFSYRRPACKTPHPPLPPLELPDALVVDEPVPLTGAWGLHGARLNGFRMDGFLERLREPVPLSSEPICPAGSPSPRATSLQP